MKKIFSLRPVLIFVLLLSLGIFTGFLFLRFGSIAFLPAAILAAVCVLSFLGNVLKKKFALFDFLFNLRFYNLVFFGAYLLGAALFFLSVSLYAKDISRFDAKECEVYGTVLDVYSTQDGNSYFLLENSVATHEGESINCGVSFVYVYGEAGSIGTGDTVFFTAVLNSAKIYEGGKINSYYLRNNIQSAFYIDGDSFVTAEGKPSFFSGIKSGIKRALFSNMRYENASISYALVTGDSLMMDKELKEEFFESGIAHIFSVSGLHISVLCAGILFLLKRLKASTVVTVIVSTIILLFYGAICGFTPPVVRSIVMAEVFFLASVTGRKYDPLCSLGAASLVILLISPLMLFDIGFLLSVSSVAGIFLFGRKTAALLSFLPKILRLPLVVSITAQAGVTPVMLLFFGKLPLFSLLLNVLAIPLVNIAYIASLILLIITLPLKFLSFLYFFPQGLIEAVKIMVKVTTSGGAATAAISLSCVACLCYFAAILPLSGFLFLKKKTKAICCTVFSALFIIFTVINMLPFSCRYTSASLPYNSEGVSLVTTGGKVYCVYYSEAKAGFDISGYLRGLKIKNVEAAFFICGGNYAQEQALMLEKFNLQKIIIPYDPSGSYEAFSVYEAENKIKYLLSGEVYVYKSLKFSAYYYNTTFCGGIVSCDSMRILYAFGADSEKTAYLGEKIYNNVNMLFADKMLSELSAWFLPQATATPQYVQSNGNKKLYSGGMHGDLIFKFNKGTIIRRYSY